MGYKELEGGLRGTSTRVIDNNWEGFGVCLICREGIQSTQSTLREGHRESRDDLEWDE